MLVKTEIETLFGMDCSFGLNDLDVEDLYTPSPESLLSDDIWKKFGLEIPDLNDFEEIFDGIDSKRQLESPNNDTISIHHDCMWAGHCVSKEHPAEEHKNNGDKQVHVAPGPQKAPVKQLQQQQTLLQQQQLLQQQPVQPGRSVLLKTVIKQPPAPPVPSPDSPPMSDDEENKNM